VSQDLLLPAVQIVVSPSKKKNTDGVVLGVTIAITSSDRFVELDLCNLSIEAEKLSRRHRVGHGV
jgi:hypothetical protein